MAHKFYNEYTAFNNSQKIAWIVCHNPEHFIWCSPWDIWCCGCCLLKNADGALFACDGDNFTRTDASNRISHKKY